MVSKIDFQLSVTKLKHFTVLQKLCRRKNCFQNQNIYKTCLLNLAVHVLHKKLAMKTCSSLKLVSTSGFSSGKIARKTCVYWKFVVQLVPLKLFSTSKNILDFVDCWISWKCVENSFWLFWNVYNKNALRFFRSKCFLCFTGMQMKTSWFGNFFFFAFTTVSGTEFKEIEGIFWNFLNWFNFDCHKNFSKKQIQSKKSVPIRIFCLSELYLNLILVDYNLRLKSKQKCVS